MNERDQNQPVNPSKLELVMPSLPELYEGVFEDVYAEYVDDPEAYTVSFMHRLGNENPFLEPFFSSDILFDEEKISVKWPMIYYDMYARSSRKAGMPPLYITEERSIQETKSRIFDIVNIIENPDLHYEFLNRRKNDSLVRETRDRSTSPELEKFWNTIDVDLQSRVQEGAYDEDLLMYLANLHILQEVMQKQHDEYALTGEYLGDDSISL